MNLIKQITFILTLYFIGSCSKSSVINPSDNLPDNDNPTTFTDAQLLDKVQKDVFNYFWDTDKGTHPVCLMAKERYHQDDPTNDPHTVTSGGTGFGFMTILVGVERGYITRSQAYDRLNTSINFLTNNVTKYHGAFPHWFNGATGATLQGTGGVADNGGDLVETAFLCEGLICIREYFKNGSTEEQELATKADNLWKGVEWSWYTKGENALYWHWSPNYGWSINFQLSGYNETMITYILGAASPTHPIQSEAYHNTWARNGNIVSGANFYGVPVVLNHAAPTGTVGPMFFSHYSFLGIDPRGLSDIYANYWSVTQNHAKAMYNYTVANPLHFNGYSSKCWGLTASYSRNSDGTTGYNAHSPTNDIGVISPTAAISNMPYTPVESMKFLRYVYEDVPTSLVGNCGPYDAFSPHYNWVTKRYLAIDQGTITPMVENYRTGLLWNLFMNAPEIKQGLINLGFHSAQHGF